ncbi:hypothetical protein FJU30_07955 [Affinibrenneria salicis]|uniref:Cupin domain-containing protein n=1 Tax=Affinibrenneria salicis TaxID=2590031 RepID=A0A5J5G3C8_9GAMM|nr:hypothetical protein [Affinibrenneria salicis]KAA9001171.1 hypothetical protein FJU30_07955 [Affinibrenneria salicis]
MNKAKLVLLMVASMAVSITGYCQPAKTPNEHAARIPAIKLINTPDNHSAFIKGSIPALEKISAQKFWLSNSTEDWEKNTHPAPRKQYVITLKGKLQFKVSDGSTFTIAPGTVLLAEDTGGAGHSWEMVEGSEWVRVYIPMVDDKDDFVAEKQ